MACRRPAALPAYAGGGVPLVQVYQLVSIQPAKQTLKATDEI
jgi:hypothetical protein